MRKIQLPQDLENRFLKLIEKSKCSDKHWLEFLHFFERFLNDTEDYLIALESLKESEERNEKHIPFEEILKKYNLDSKD